MFENNWIQEKIENFADGNISKDFIENTIKPTHGTTTLAFVFKEGMIIAVDSRATAGSYIASQSVNKVIEINKYLLGTMAGGAADCYYWETKMGVYADSYEIKHGKRISVGRASQFLALSIKPYKGYGLSMGTMICGYDGDEPKIYMVDNDASRIEGNLFSVGSGSTIAHGVLSAKYDFNMSKEEAIQLGKDAIYCAGHRDAYSGGTVNVYFMNKEGWVKIGRWDFNEVRKEKEAMNQK
ncbi:PRE2 [Ecytonucleospora hepatopenaei]|uniref:Proteasome subunit beta n=1 Tax=Ecytonucleospora hepatopenaei TaxID=646526 RepID=A0A1W0E5D0_9MICR|nr:PRE2 [Ecytonucleospora hepatopenaei]